MKKRLLAILLSALLAANISACSYVQKKNIESTKTDAESTGSNTNNAPSDTKNIVEDTGEIDADVKASWDGSLTCNGDFRSSKASYIYDPNNGLSIHVDDWNEDRFITSFSNIGVISFNLKPQAIGVNSERAFLILYGFSDSPNQMTVISFEKGSVSETVTNLDVDENVYEISGNFINENIGYIFAFSAVSGHHAQGSSKLSHFFKTEDGGKTWNFISMQSAPLISLSERVIFSKMVSENVGIISGRYWADDYSFSKRNLLTTDGGLNWVNITELPQIDTLCGQEITDFTQVEDAYILTIRYKTSETDRSYAKYKSLDLITWVRIT